MEIIVEIRFAIRRRYGLNYLRLQNQYCLLILTLTIIIIYAFLTQSCLDWTSPILRYGSIGGTKQPSFTFYSLARILNYSILIYYKKLENYSYCVIDIKTTFPRILTWINRSDPHLPKNYSWTLCFRIPYWISIQPKVKTIFSWLNPLCINWIFSKDTLKYIFYFWITIFI